MDLWQLSAHRCLAVLETYLVEDVAEVQGLLMHGRMVKSGDAKPSPQVLAEHFASKLPDAPVADAHSEEAMRAQAEAERALGGPANG